MVGWPGPTGSHRNYWDGKTDVDTLSGMVSHNRV